MALDPTWWSLPSDRHSQSANLSFAAGHVADQRWKFRRSILEKLEVTAQGKSGGIAIARVSGTGSSDYFVQFHRTNPIRVLHQIGWQFRKVTPVFAECRFGQHFAKCVEIGLWRAGTFWRNVTDRAYQ